MATALRWTLALSCLCACGAATSETKTAPARASDGAGTGGAGTRADSTDISKATDASADAGTAATIDVVDAAGSVASGLSGDTRDAGVDAGHRRPVRIAGKCVDVAAIAKRLPYGDPPRVDLDGDGVDDWIVTTGADTQYHGSVFITRGRCGIDVLDWDEGPPQTADTTTNGFVDLETSRACKAGCCPNRTFTIFVWSSGKYVQAGTRTETRSCGIP
jgi:hypothetical protein